MSLRQVLTIYNAERQLSDDETALLNTLRKMTDAERGMFVDGLSDKPQKKSGKKSAGGGGGRSSRGESLKQQIKGTGANPNACQYRNDNGDRCTDLKESAVHTDTMYLSYHPFQPAEQAAATSGD